MAQWKKIITSGSNAALNSITASNNISASGHLFFSASATTAINHKILVQDPTTGQVFTTGSVGGGGGGGSGVATEIVLGADTTGNLLLNAGTSVQSSIDQINSVLDLLAPTVPPNLSAVSLGFTDDTNFYQAKDRNGNTSSSITNNTSPSFETSEKFFDGNSGVLRAQHFPSSSGDVGTGYNSDFSIFDIGLDASDNTGVSNILQIVSDTDPYEGVAGSSGFYKVLFAKINLSSITPNNVGNYQRNTVRLIHTQTGTNGIDKEFTIDSDPETSVSDLEVSYNESINGFHYQSGIKYLGHNNTISASYKVTINSNANYIDTNGRIAQINDSPDIFTDQDFKIGINVSYPWSPGQTFNATSSMPVTDDKFNTGNITLNGRKFKASSTTFSGTDDTTSISNLLVDSKQEDETNPSNGIYTTFRSSSGKGHAPEFLLGNSDITKCGQSFDKTQELNSTNNFEFQFSNGDFHWPTSVNYESYIPAGPNYTGINLVGDDTNDQSENPMRYALFNIGTISDASGVDFVIQGAHGFDTVFGGDASFQQSSHDFQLGIIVMETGTNTRVTQWIDANSPHDQVSNTTLNDYDKGAVTGGTIASSGNLTRNITFGGVQKSGTVYVRIGYSYNTTRKFQYIYKI